MARKSKTQRAKASANRAAKRASALEVSPVEAIEVDSDPKQKRIEAKKAKKAEREAAKKAAEAAKKAAKKNKKPSFLSEVKAELKRVTWPSRQDVLRWSGVVIVALFFFGIFTLVLDNEIVSRVLYGIASLGA